MSVDGQVLGVSTVTGGGAAGVSTLVNTGNPLVIGIAAAAAMLIVLGLVTRFAHKR